MALADEMRSLAKELEEVAVAVSLVGTSHTKVGELAKRATAIADQLHGDRPEVKKLRSEIVRRVHDLKVVPKNQKAARAMRALRAAIETARNAVKNGLGDVPFEFDMNFRGPWTGFPVGNAWGYTAAEADSSLRALRRTFTRLAELGLRPSKDITLVLDPTWSEGWSAKYDRDWEAIVMDPEGRGTEGGGSEGQSFQMAVAMGHHLWHEVMKGTEREAWPSVGAFALAFGTFLVGQPVTADDAARLVVTIGKHATEGWPTKVPIR